MDGGAWRATVHGVTESDTTGRLHFPLHLLQCSSFLHVNLSSFISLRWGVRVLAIPHCMQAGHSSWSFFSCTLFTQFVHKIAEGEAGEEIWWCVNYLLFTSISLIYGKKQQVRQSSVWSKDVEVVPGPEVSRAGASCRELFPAQSCPHVCLVSLSFLSYCSQSRYIFSGPKFIPHRYACGVGEKVFLTKGWLSWWQS